MLLVCLFCLRVSGPPGRGADWRNIERASVIQGTSIRLLNRAFGPRAGLPEPILGRFGREASANNKI